MPSCAVVDSTILEKAGKTVKKDTTFCRQKTGQESRTESMDRLSRSKGLPHFWTMVGKVVVCQNSFSESAKSLGRMKTVHRQLVSTSVLETLETLETQSLAGDTNDSNYRSQQTNCQRRRARRNVQIPSANSAVESMQPKHRLCTNFKFCVTFKSTCPSSWQHQLSCGSQWAKTTLAFERAPSEVLGLRQHSAFAWNSGIGMVFGSEDNAPCGTRGSWKLGAAAEPLPNWKPQSILKNGHLHLGHLREPS